MIATGSTISRLSELRKYTITDDFTKQYFSGGNSTVDGVDYLNSISGYSITYYLNGIKYLDILTGTTSGTTYSFTPEGTGSTANFIYAPYYKDPNKEWIDTSPKINNDVFIDRQQLSAFESNYRLEQIRNLSDLETYASGKYFNIIKNS
jgi:hypothetical protein